MLIFKKNYSYNHYNVINQLKTYYFLLATCMKLNFNYIYQLYIIKKLYISKI
jgi:hypothetical protein